MGRHGSIGGRQQAPYEVRERLSGTTGCGRGDEAAPSRTGKNFTDTGRSKKDPLKKCADAAPTAIRMTIKVTHVGRKRAAHSEFPRLQELSATVCGVATGGTVR